MFLKEIGFSRLFRQRMRISTRRQFATVILKLNTLNFDTSLWKAVSCHTFSTCTNPTACRQSQSESIMETADSKKGEESKVSFSGTFLDMAKSLNLKLTKDSTPYCSKVICPGEAVESHFLNGHPSVSGLLKILSAARVYAFHMPADDSGRSLFEYDHITANSYTFMSSSLLRISSCMYDHSIPKWPLQVRVEGGHIGRSSLSFVTHVTSLGDPNRRELISQISQVVKVDQVTRRPLPIEDKWRDLYQSKCVRGEPLIIKRQNEPASGPLNVCEVKVALSDTDVYQHTNFASYPRFAVDAVHDTFRQGKLDGILSQADISSGVSQVKLAYLGESEEGDVLKVKMWPVEDSKRTVLCSLEKDGQVINQVTITYHSPGNKL